MSSTLLKSISNLWPTILGVFILSGCSSTPHPKTNYESINLAHPLSFKSFANRRPAENGGPRGGGDPVAGEFMEYERIALAKMEAWKKQGKIKMTEVELAKIRALMPPNDPFNPKHIVTSEDHACLTDVKLADGNCLHPNDERDVIKQPFAIPPRLIVGRIRWNETSNTPARKEFLAQHELRGLALSVKGKPFVDEDFSQTYNALTESTKEWNEAIHAHLDYLREIRVYDEMLDLVDLTHFETAKNTLVFTSAEYKRCVNTSDTEYKAHQKVSSKSEIESTKVYRDCFQALNQLQEIMLQFGVPQIQAQANHIQEKSEAVQKNWQAWLNALENQNWHTWFHRSITSYLSNRQIAIDKSNRHKFDKNEVLEKYNAALFAHCPRVENPDFRKVAKCNVEHSVQIANDLFKSFLKNLIDDLISAHEKTVDQVILQVDPI